MNVIKWVKDRRAEGVHIETALSDWQAKQAAAAPGRYYGGTGTIHGTGYLDVEVYQGEVVSVWFRCQELPFKQANVSASRGEEMQRMKATSAIIGIELLDS